MHKTGSLYKIPPPLRGTPLIKGGGRRITPSGSPLIGEMSNAHETERSIINIGEMPNVGESERSRNNKSDVG